MYEWAELGENAGLENLGTWCMSEDKREAMKLLGCDEKYNNGQSSDFEQLAEWERILPLCTGMGSVALYKKQLSLLGIDEEKKGDVCELWREGNAKIKIASDFSKKYQEIIEKQGIDFCCYVMNIAKSKKESPQDILSLLQEFAEQLSLTSEPKIILRWNAECFSYARPDRYHAECYWQRLLRDEKLNEEEAFVLAFQSLIEVLLVLKSKKIPVVLHVRSSNFALREKMISYLRDHHLMLGEVRFSIFCDEPSVTFSELCLLSNSEMRILPELLLRPSDFCGSLSSSMRALMSKFPIGGLRYGGLLTDSFSMALAARELFSQTLNSLLLDLNVCDEKRQEIIDIVVNY